MSRVAARYARGFDRIARRVTLLRVVANAPPVEVQQARARIRGFADEEVAGGIKSGERQIMILAEDVPLSIRPLRQGDRIVVDGLHLTFTARPDDQTHRDGETLLAYVAVASGG